MRLNNVMIGLFLALVASSPARSEAVKCLYSGPENAPVSQQEWKVFLLHKNSPVYQTADLNCDGMLQQSEVKFYSRTEEEKIRLALHDVERLANAGKPVKVTAKGDTIPPVLGTLEPAPADCLPGWNFLLRDGFEDVSIFTCPKQAKLANGALLGWSDDEIANNESWSAKGFAAVSYSTQYEAPVDPFEPYVVGFALAPGVKFNRLTNSSNALKSKEVDLLSFNLTGEAGFGNVLGGTQYLRVRGAYNTQFDGDPKSWSLTGEWQPITNSDFFALSSPNYLGPLTWQLDPILRFQYAEQLNGSSDPLFSDHDKTLRIGPVLTLNIAPQKDDLVVPKWLQPASFTMSYEWLDDLYSNNEYPLFGAAINFALDEAGHVGIKLSYQNGKLEETGQKIDQVQIGLTAKW